MGCLLALMLAASVGCESSGGDREDRRKAVSRASTSPRSGGRLVIGVQQEPERLSDILNSTATTNLVCNLIFSKFVKYDDELRLIPDIIEDIPTLENGGVSPDHLTYTYRLRPDVRWHDGKRLTSADVAFTYDIIMSPDVMVESREGFDVIASVDTPDPRTVVFRLKKPYPDFVSETFLDESILPKHLLEDVVQAEFHLADYHRAPSGSGPFRFKEWVAGSHVVLERNDRYYGEGPYLDEIIIKFIADENTLLIQLKTGEIDLYDNANSGVLDEIAGLRGIRVYDTPSLMYEHLDLNNENPILSDKRVRQALGYATDRADITTRVYRSRAQVAMLDEHPSSKYFNSSAASEVRHDPLRARQLLRSAGWVDRDGDGILENGDTDLVLTISATAGNPDREKTEVLLKRQYREVGIDLRIKNYDANVLYGSYEDGGILKRGTFDIAMYAWLSSPEPASKTSLYGEDAIPPHGQNHPRIRHAELTDLLERASGEVNEQTRIELYRRVSEILVEEVPVIPLFWYTNLDLCTAKLQNYRPNPSQSTDTWNASTWHLAD